jgi:hypothetical protein
MLELAADLRFLHEAAQHLGLVLVAFQQDLDGQVAAQVRIAPSEHGSHPAPRDLAKELIAIATLGGLGRGIGGRVGDGQTGFVGVRLGQEHPGNRTDRPSQALQDVAGLRRLETEGHVLIRRALRQRPGLWLQPGAGHAGRAGTRGCIGGKRFTTLVAAVILGHRGSSVPGEWCQSTVRTAACLYRGGVPNRVLAGQRLGFRVGTK